MTMTKTAMMARDEENPPTKASRIERAQPPPLQSILQEQLTQRAQAKQLRNRRIVRNVDPVHVEIDGRSYVNFCSNNYLGLTHHPRVIAAMRDSVAENGAGAGAAGLISGYSAIHAAAESNIARWKGTAAAVLLPSGYQANCAAVQTLAAVGEGNAGGVRFLIDKLAHASLIDAVKGSGSEWRVIPHNGITKLRRLLTEAKPGQLQVFVTESIFSMDGDAADLAGIVQLKKEIPFVLLLDEAHGSGVYGPGGAGLAAELGFSRDVDVSVVTFSKAAGCLGGAICGSETLRDAVLNFGRAYIYSTSATPAMAAGIGAAIDVMRDEPQRQKRVRESAKKFRDRLAARGFEVSPGDSPIVPIILGEEPAALSMAQRLGEVGFLVQAVRPPTVPRGTSRLRVTLCCEHTDAQIGHLADSILKFIK